jgi:hypothetical protein
LYLSNVILSFSVEIIFIVVLYLRGDKLICETLNSRQNTEEIAGQFSLLPPPPTVNVTNHRYENLPQAELAPCGSEIKM